MTASPPPTARPVVVVLGLGYVGLPLAQAAVRGPARGRPRPTPASSPRLKAGPLARRRRRRRRRRRDARSRASAPTTDAGCDRARPDTVVICVPTPLSEDGAPDLGAVRASAAMRRRAPARAGTLVVLESTTYPGTTEEVVRPILEAVGLRGRRRLPPGLLPRARSTPATRRLRHHATPPRSSAGVTAGVHATGRPRSTASSSTPSCPAKGTREAEMAKLLENTYRHVNIALVNEMARFCHELGIDLWDVIELRQDQAVRVPGVLPGPGRRRALHPDRPELPHPQRAGAARLPVPVRRAGAGDQRRHAGLRRPADPGPPQRRRQGRARARRCCCSASPTSPTSPTSASRRPSRWPEAAARMGADVRFHDPYVAAWNAAEHGEPEPCSRGARPGRRRRGGRRGRPAAGPPRVPGRRPGRRPRIFDTRGVLSGETVERL